MRSAIETTEPTAPAPRARLETAGPISAMVPVLARTHRSLAMVLLKELDLSPGQELMLTELWDREPRSQVDLATALGVEPPSAAKMLARMERSGLVERHRSAEDRRVVLVGLTARGRALREPVARIWADLEQRTLAGLTEPERRTLLQLLQRVTTNATSARGQIPRLLPGSALVDPFEDPS